MMGTALDTVNADMTSGRAVSECSRRSCRRDTAAFVAVDDAMRVRLCRYDVRAHVCIIYIIIYIYNILCVPGLCPDDSIVCWPAILLFANSLTQIIAKVVWAVS
jgi:hypothetical protein